MSEEFGWRMREVQCSEPEPARTSGAGEDEGRRRSENGSNATAKHQTLTETEMTRRKEAVTTGELHVVQSYSDRLVRLSICDIPESKVRRGFQTYHG
jgi:hypothetical protein